MSIGTALTVIAVALAIFAVLAIIAVVILIRLLLHLVQLEKNLSHQMGQLTRQVQDVLSDWKTASHRIGHTVERIRFTTESAKGILSLLSVFPFRKPRVRHESRRPGFIEWVRLAFSAYTLFQRRRRTRSKKTPPSQPSQGM